MTPKVNSRVSGATLGSVIFIGVLQLLTDAAPPSLFTLVSWKWDYSLGIIKRGFPGWILDFAAPDRTPTLVLQLSLGLYLACLTIFALYAAIVAHRRPTIATVAVAAAGVVLAPALPSFAMTLGRLDQLNFLALLLCVLLVTARVNLAVILAVVVISCVAVLIHEAFIVVQLPLIGSLFYLRVKASRDRHPLLRLALLTGPPLLTAIVLTIATRHPPVELPEWVSYWSARSPILPSEDIYADQVHFRGLRENIGFTLHHVRQHPLGLLSGMFVAALLVPFSALIFVEGLASNHEARSRWYSVWACSLSPFAMFFVGTDFLRWCSYTLLNLIVALLAFIFIEDPVPFRSTWAWPFPARYAAGLVVIGLLCFPLSTGEDWPHFSRYTLCVYSAILKPTSIRQYCNGFAGDMVVYE